MVIWVVDLRCCCLQEYHPTVVAKTLLKPFDICVVAEGGGLLSLLGFTVCVTLTLTCYNLFLDYMQKLVQVPVLL